MAQTELAAYFMKKREEFDKRESEKPAKKTSKTKGLLSKIGKNKSPKRGGGRGDGDGSDDEEEGERRRRRGRRGRGRDDEEDERGGRDAFGGGGRRR